MKKKEIIKVKGFKATGLSAGIKSTDKKDLALIYSEKNSVGVGVFTQNRFAAAPIVVSREHLQAEPEAIRAIVANSGNANACTGEEGIRNARKMAEVVAKNLGLRPTQVLVASTGIIGKQLPMKRVIRGIGLASTALKADGWQEAAEAIMTTDTHPKISRQVIKLPQGKISLLGIAKGAGMINPQLATMLAFIVTDAVIKYEALKLALNYAVERSFHCLTIDGDTSTNDTIFLLANGFADNEVIAEDSELFPIFRKNLLQLCVELAKQIAADGEGATKFIEITITGAKSQKDAREVAKRIATSLLVKTAIFGNDPNWGRIACAIGNSGATFDPQRVAIKIGDYCVFKNGIPVPFEIEPLRGYLQKNKEIKIGVELGAGAESANFWTCDLSSEYVKINAHYHT